MDLPIFMSMPINLLAEIKAYSTVIDAVDHGIKLVTVTSLTLLTPSHAPHIPHAPHAPRNDKTKDAVTNIDVTSLVIPKAGTSVLCITNPNPVLQAPTEKLR